ncbi:hypothetical protein [Flavobacterium sp.]|uniref:hypothetical protein n=1 Tax=Flavobacterium sp. TaxID=239 RepID=UPI002633A3E7|nr:hypothetical protein [Flavobacterium sp.]
MKIRIFLFLIYSSLSFGQKPLEIIIDSIQTSDSISDVRKFTVNYHIQNTTNKEVMFINCAFPLTNFYPDVTKLNVFSVIVENNKYIRLNILHKDISYLRHLDSLANAESAEAKAKIILAYIKNRSRDTTKMKSEVEKRKKINDFEYVKSAIQIFQPKEIRSFTETLYWNKKRYYKVDDLEYYIDEKEPYYLELSMVFFKKEFQYFFEEEHFKKMINNPNFLEGHIISNKVEMNFKE